MNIAYYIIFFFWYLLSLLPLRVLYVISDILYIPLYYIVKYRKKIIRKNLMESFPDKSEHDIKRIEKKFYHFFCDYIVETIKLFSISRKEMKKRISFSGVDEMIKALDADNKQFCFLFLGHYCNWEWVASLPYWVPEEWNCGQIYHPLYNKSFDSLFLKLRGRFGGTSVPMKDTFRYIIKQKREGRKLIMGFIADQGPKWESMHHWTTFLNHDTSFFIGAEKIGKQVDAAFYFVDIKRTRRGYYHAELKPMTLKAKEYPDYDITDMYSSMLEKMISDEPSFWLWSHNRWKRTKEEWKRIMQKNDTKTENSPKG